MNNLITEYIMYAHRTIQRLSNLRVQFDLPPEFVGCTEAEIIVLPIASSLAKVTSWEERVLAVAGTLGDDFPDHIDDSDLGEDANSTDRVIFSVVWVSYLFACFVALIYTMASRNNRLY